MPVPKPGTLVILGMFVLGCASAVAAVWYRHSESAQVLAVWGGQSAELIARAPRVEAWRLAPSTTRAPDGADSKNMPRAAARTRAEAAPGLVHVRHALVDDATFEWPIPARPRRPNWRYALHFADGPREVTVLFDPQTGWIGTNDGRRLRLKPTPAEGMGVFFETLFPPSGAAPNDQG